LFPPFSIRFEADDNFLIRKPSLNPDKTGRKVNGRRRFPGTAPNPFLRSEGKFFRVLAAARDDSAAGIFAFCTSGRWHISWFSIDSNALRHGRGA
jgi:hypothetical protein